MGTSGRSRSTYGSAPMWSSCACVRMIPRTFALFSRRYVMSGMTRSMPSISSSGNIRPASTTTMSSPCSMASMFLPISPTPPRGMMRIALAKERHLIRCLFLPHLLLGHRFGREKKRQRREVAGERAAQRGLMQRRRRVIDREDRQALDLARPPVDPRDRFARQEPTHRVPPERDDDLGLQDLEMPLQPDVAGRHLVRQRVAVLRGAVPDDVGDEHLA